MNEEEYVDKINADLKDRELWIAGIVASCPRTGKLQFITYDPKGLVDTISRPGKSISIYRNAESGGGMYEILTLSGIKRELKSETVE